MKPMMSARRALSSTMMAALRVICERGHGEVERWTGGWWTFPGAKMLGPVSPDDPVGPRPEWYTTAGTIWALHARGMIAMRCVPPVNYETLGTVTEAGWSVVRQQDRSE